MQKHIISRNTAEQTTVRGGGDQIRLELVVHYSMKFYSHWRCATKLARTEKKAYSVAKTRNTLAVQEESIFSGCSD